MSEYRRLRTLHESNEETWAGKVRLIGYDRDPKAIKAARANIDSAGLHGIIHVEKRDVLDSSTETVPPKTDKGLVLVNPPYGERLDSAYTLIPIYASLGEFFSKSPFRLEGRGPYL